MTEPSKPTCRIALIGDFSESVKAHKAIPRALELAATATAHSVEPVWMQTNTLHGNVVELLSSFNGIWCVPGSPYENMTGALEAIRFAREHARPFLGTCGGFKHTLLEYARNVHRRLQASPYVWQEKSFALGASIGLVPITRQGKSAAHLLSAADHAESNPDAELPLLSPLSCSLVGRVGEVQLLPGSRLASFYGTSHAREAYHCNYGLTPRYRHLFEKTSLHMTAFDDHQELRGVELDGHPFFIATLFQPELAALENRLHPLILSFVRAAIT